MCFILLLARCTFSIDPNHHMNSNRDRAYQQSRNYETRRTYSRPTLKPIDPTNPHKTVIPITTKPVITKIPKPIIIYTRTPTKNFTFNPNKTAPFPTQRPTKSPTPRTSYRTRSPTPCYQSSYSRCRTQSRTPTYKSSRTDVIVIPISSLILFILCCSLTMCACYCRNCNAKKKQNTPQVAEQQEITGQYQEPLLAQYPGNVQEQNLPQQPMIYVYAAPFQQQPQNVQTYHDPQAYAPGAFAPDQSVAVQYGVPPPSPVVVTNQEEPAPNPYANYLK